MTNGSGQHRQDRKRKSATKKKPQANKKPVTVAELTWSKVTGKVKTPRPTAER